MLADKSLNSTVAYCTITQIKKLHYHLIN